MKKYIKASLESYKLVGNASPLRYELDTENALIEFKNNMALCDDVLIIKGGNVTYTVLAHCTDCVDWDNEYMQERFNDETVSDLDVLIDYILTDGADADDLDFYFNVDKYECDNLVDLIKTMARIYGWE